MIDAELSLALWERLFPTSKVLCDTPELAERFGVRLGDLVLVHEKPEFRPEVFDD